MDMKNIDGHYDGIYCIGNTLVYYLNFSTTLNTQNQIFK